MAKKAENLMEDEEDWDDSEAEVSLDSDDWESEELSDSWPDFSARERPRNSRQMIAELQERRMLRAQLEDFDEYVI